MDTNGKSVVRLNAWAFGLATGITWGFSAILLGMLTLWFNFGPHTQQTMANVYMSNNASVSGILIGMVLAFINGLVMGAIFAYLYNIFNHYNKGYPSTYSTDNKPYA